MMVWYVLDNQIIAEVPGCGCGCEIHFVAVPVADTKELGLVDAVREMQRMHDKWAGRCPYS